MGVDDVLVTVGGTIPADDIPELKRLGVAEVFTPGAGTDEIVEEQVEDVPRVADDADDAVDVTAVTEDGLEDAVENGDEELAAQFE